MLDRLSDLGLTKYIEIGNQSLRSHWLIDWLHHSYKFYYPLIDWYRFRSVAWVSLRLTQGSSVSFI
jgi:hypothetical protein